MRIATRGSELALWQAHLVSSRLQALESVAECEIVVVSTSGDRDVTSPLHQIGGKGVFVKEVQAAVLDGRADLAVHSAKDLPAVTPEGLVLAAVPERGDPRDALVGSTLSDLAVGATVATGSMRRRAELARLRPDLAFVELRGNIATRLGRVPDGGAIVAAAVALERLRVDQRIAERLEVDQMIPQVGQGALAVECRADDATALAALSAIDHVEHHRVLRCERAFLRELGGDCTLPAGAHAVLEDDQVVLRAFLAAEDLTRQQRTRVSGSDGEALGCDAAADLRRALEQR